MTKINYQNEWQISNDVFHENTLSKFESLMALGNGYLTIRNAHEEDYVLTKRNLFVAGVFNRFSENEVTELATLPDVGQIRIWINGTQFSLLQGEVENYSHLFNYQTGESIRSFAWRLTESVYLRFRFSKFVSMSNQHLLLTRVEVENLGDSVAIAIESGIDGTVTNTGSQHFEEGEKRFFHNRHLYLKTKTTESNVQVAIACHHHLSVPHQSKTKMKRRQLLEWKEFSLATNETACLTKYAIVKTSRDLNYDGAAYLEDKLFAEFEELSQQSYADLSQQSQASWQAIWSQGYIQIKGSALDALLLNFSRYHLHAMAPIQDPRLNIGAKGMTGEGYKGHTFWDTEIFILPYFTYTYPDWAKNLVRYRINGLQAAQENAKKNGYQGAQYPWESAWLSDGETTPEFGDIDIVTGEATPILTGKLEHHVTADVTFGAWRYLQTTKDAELAEPLFEVVFETAKFWCSRVTWNQFEQRYEILDVIGPDEYKEHVNNNAYTNYLVKFNLDCVLKMYEQLAEKDRVEVSKADIETIREVAAKLYTPKPNQQGIIPQDDSYLNKEIIDLTQYLEDEKVGTMFNEYNLEQVNQLQVTKQADVLLLLSLFKEQFDEEVLNKNWNYYYPKTLHDSSLSLTTHCTFALQLGKIELAYSLFRKAFDIDLGERDMNSSDSGVHSAAMGGIWQNVVLGFGGFSLNKGLITIQPRLPKEWEALSYTVNIIGAKLEVTIDNKSVLIKVLKGNVSRIEINGKIYSIDNTQLLVNR